MPTKTLSRQRRWQIVRAKQGLCTQCSRIAFRSGRCRACFIKKRLTALGIDLSQHPKLVTKILIRWGQLDRGREHEHLMWPTPGYLSMSLTHWILRWDKRIGGPKYARTKSQ